jgi:predicted phosphodiesterase
MKKTRWFIAILFAIATFSVYAAAGPGIDYGPWLTGVTQHSVTVKWGSSPSVGKVEYGPTAALGREAEAVYAGGVHQAELTSLAAGARCYYRVTGGGETGKLQSFLTAPEPTAPFHFGVLSDTQGAPSAYAAVIEPLKATDPAFVLHNGDLVDYPFVDLEWRHFWGVTDRLAGQAPYFPVRGNHDGMLGGKQHFALYWSNPRNNSVISRSVYSFQYGNTYFIALDINEPYAAGSPQHQWLARQLAYAKIRPDVKHCIVYAHFPPYSCSAHGADANVLEFRAAVVPLFEKYDIDLSLAGHDHGYQRSVVNGITYVVAGCASSRTYSCNPQSWTLKCEKTTNFANIAIDGEAMRVEARRPDRSLIDSFTITHDFHGRS